MTYQPLTETIKSSAKNMWLDGLVALGCDKLKNPLRECSGCRGNAHDLASIYGVFYPHMLAFIKQVEGERMSKTEVTSHV